MAKARKSTRGRFPGLEEDLDGINDALVEHESTLDELLRRMDKAEAEIGIRSHPVGSKKRAAAPPDLQGPTVVELTQAFSGMRDALDSLTSNIAFSTARFIKDAPLATLLCYRASHEFLVLAPGPLVQGRLDLWHSYLVGQRVVCWWPTPTPPVVQYQDCSDVCPASIRGKHHDLGGRCSWCAAPLGPQAQLGADGRTVRTRC